MEINSAKFGTLEVIYTREGLTIFLDANKAPICVVQSIRPGMPSSRAKWFSQDIVYLIEERKLPLSCLFTGVEAVRLIRLMLDVPNLFQSLKCVFIADVRQDNGNVVQARYTDANGIMNALNSEVENILFTIESYA